MRGPYGGNGSGNGNHDDNGNCDGNAIFAFRGLVP